MQINLRTAQTGAGAYTTFADSVNTISPRANADLIDYGPPALKLMDQIEALAGGAGQFVANRQNALWSLSIRIMMWYATATAAREQVATLGAALNIGTVDLQIFEVSSADATYMPACSISEFAPKQGAGQQGIYLEFTLKFTGNNFTTTAP